MPFFFIKNYVIFNVLKTILAKYKLLTLNCKLYKTNSLIHIYLSYINIRKKKTKDLSDRSKIETSLFINKIINTLNEYTKNKLNFYIIVQNVKKYLIQLKLFSTYNWIKKRVQAKLKKYANKYKILNTLLQIFFIVITKSNSAQLLSSYISYIFRFKAYKKDHLKLFKLFKTIIQLIIYSKISIISGIKIILSGRINGFARSRTRYFQQGHMPLNTFNVNIDYASNTAYSINGTLGVKVWIFEKKLKTDKKLIMMFKKIAPITPSQRNLVKLKNLNNLEKHPLLKSEMCRQKKKSGKNNEGKTTVFHKGGGHKQKYRKIEFLRVKSFLEIVLSVEYDPYRTSYISALYNQNNKTYKYILTPKNLIPGDIVKSGTFIYELKLGFSLPLKNIPVGSSIHNISTKPNSKGKINRAAGTYAKIIKKDLKNVFIKLNSGKLKKFSINCFATLGTVSNEYKFLNTVGKAGRSRWLNRRPTVRGVAMNPIDHPNGGGEGKTSGKKVTPWGKIR